MWDKNQKIKMFDDRKNRPSNAHTFLSFSIRASMFGLLLSVSLVCESTFSITEGNISSKETMALKSNVSDEELRQSGPEEVKTVHTLQDALEAAYQNNSELKELQAQLRARDEGVPQALAGWRPTVYANASLTGQKQILSGDVKDNADAGMTNFPTTGSNSSTVNADVTLNQNLFNGGKTVAQTNQAEHVVQVARAQLVDKEREVLLNAARAYLEVVARTAELSYRKSNEEALKKTLEATQDKYNVGEETRTSIAQAEANLADGVAQRETAEAELLSGKATFEQVTGARPGTLAKPAVPLNLPKDLKEAIEIAKKDNPSVLAALFQERADRSAIKVNDADLLPKVDLQGQVSRQGRNNLNKFTNRNNTKTNDFTTAQQVSVSLRMPLYEGGSIRAKTRELREVAEQRRISIETARRKVIQELIKAWETYSSAKSNIVAYEKQVAANKVSLEGTREEMLVGSKILLDVLNAQRELVNSQLNLVRAMQRHDEALMTIRSLIGSLTALRMKLKVKRYDPQAHYQQVRNSW